MPSSISSFERTIPALPWNRLTWVASLLTVGAVLAWELYCRSLGYAPTLNDTPDLWAQRREAVRSNSIVIVGDSRALFVLDLDELEKGLGQRPIQLAIAGSCAYPILANLAADQKFQGTVICSIVPLMFFAPGGPLIANSEDALKKHRTWTVSQRASHELAMLLEARIAFLKQDDLTLSQLLKRLPIPNRPGAQVPPPLPPYFSTCDHERRTRMFAGCAHPGPLQTRVKTGWLPLFTPPPPPSFVPKEIFLDGVHRAVEARFHDAAAAVKTIRSRGGKVVFVRLPVSGEIKKIEDQATPRVGPWTRLLTESGAPGIYFEDYPDLAGFDCPEWSHLSNEGSIELSRRLAPHLKKALSE